MRSMIIEDYKERIALSTIPGELKDALKTNDRVPRFIDNLTGEITRCEHAGIPLTRTDIKQMVYNMTDVFIACLESQINKRAASEIADQQKTQAFVDKFDNQGNADLTEEFGVKIVDG